MDAPILSPLSLWGRDDIGHDQMWRLIQAAAPMAAALGQIEKLSRNPQADLTTIQAIAQSALEKTEPPCAK